MIVLLGGSGYVGSAYRRIFEHQGLPYRSLSRAELDYANPALLAGRLREVGARFLINAAGYTGKPNVDACEHHKSETLFGNAVLPGRVAEACADAGIPWGQVSSGCIFTGSHADGSGFTEEDEPNFSFRQNNCSFYSGSKALGEEALANVPDVYIWRMRIPFNHLDGPRNYLSKLMRYSRLLEATNSITHLMILWCPRWPAGSSRFPSVSITSPIRVISPPMGWWSGSGPMAWRIMPLNFSPTKRNS